MAWRGFTAPTMAGARPRAGCPPLMGCLPAQRLPTRWPVLMVVLFDSCVRGGSNIAKSRATQGRCQAGVRPLEPA
jgi:hypothetical protein